MSQGDGGPADKAPPGASSVPAMNGWDVIDESEVLRLVTQGGAGRVELRRPESLNAFDDRLAVELLGALRRLGADDAGRAVVATGARRALSAGGGPKGPARGGPGA